MLYSGREKIDQMDSEQFLYDGGLCINILLHLEYHNEIPQVETEQIRKQMYNE